MLLATWRGPKRGAILRLPLLRRVLREPGPQPADPRPKSQYIDSKDKDNGAKGLISLRREGLYGATCELRTASPWHSMADEGRDPKIKDTWTVRAIATDPRRAVGERGGHRRRRHGSVKNGQALGKVG